MPFLYHTAGAAPNRKALPPCLAHLAGCDWHTRPVTRGPKGAGDGFVFAPQAFLDVGQVAFLDSLKWRPLHGGGTQYSVALVEPIPPLAKLSRENQVAGPRLVLDDGRRWQIPLARYYVGEGDQVGWSTNIPQELDLSDGDELVRGEPLPAFASLWRTADAWNRLRLGALEEAEQKQWASEKQWLVAAAEILAANYRVGLRELMLCGALRSRQTAERILDAAIDLHSLRELQKKSQEASALRSPSPGAAESSPATNPPPPT